MVQVYTYNDYGFFRGKQILVGPQCPEFAILFIYYINMTYVNENSMKSTMLCVDSI